MSRIRSTALVSALSFLLLVSLAPLVQAPVTVGTDVDFIALGTQTNYSFSTTFVFSTVRITSTELVLDGKGLAATPSPATSVKVVISQFDPAPSSGTTFVRFNATTTPRTVWFNFSGWTPGTQLHYYANAVLQTTITADGNGVASFTWASWSTVSFEVRLGAAPGPSGGEDVIVASGFEFALKTFGNMSFSSNQTFTEIEIASTRAVFDDVGFGVTKLPAAYPVANVSITTWDPHATENGSVAIAFTGTANTGSTVYFNLTGLVPLEAYRFTVNGTTQAETVSNASGNVSFSWSSWSTNTFQILLLGGGGIGGPGTPGITMLLAAFDYILNGRTVTFIDKSVSNASGRPPIVSWFWAFGDGDSATVEQPTHTYETQGLWTVYRVKLVSCDAMGNCGAAEELITIYDWPLILMALGLSVTLVAAVAIVVRRRRRR